MDISLEKDERMEDDMDSNKASTQSSTWVGLLFAFEFVWQRFDLVAS